jgi:signal transduction histidine kinase
MFLAKEYYHELKSPAFYQFNQLKRLQDVEDPTLQKAMIESTINQAEKLIDEMERALKKIAHDDFGRFPKPIVLTDLIRQKARLNVSEPVTIVGDKTLIKTLIQNLYTNALESCGTMKSISTDVCVTESDVVLSIKNPTPEGTSIDTTDIFKSGFTSKEKGTGLGLTLCQHIVDIHGGTIQAYHSKHEQIFEVTVRFPKPKEPSHADQAEQIH